jgi:hypothetical protein
VLFYSHYRHAGSSHVLGVWKLTKRLTSLEGLLLLQTVSCLPLAREIVADIAYFGVCDANLEDRPVDWLIVELSTVSTTTLILQEGRSPTHHTNRCVCLSSMSHPDLSQLPIPMQAGSGLT